MAVEVHVEHVIRCIFCSSEHVGGTVNERGQFYGHCMTCGGRFWENPPPLTIVKNP